MLMAAQPSDLQQPSHPWDLTMQRPPDPNASHRQQNHAIFEQTRDVSADALNVTEFDYSHQDANPGAYDYPHKDFDSDGSSQAKLEHVQWGSLQDQLFRPGSADSNSWVNHLHSPTNFNDEHTSKFHYYQQHVLDFQDQLSSPCSDDSSSCLHNVKSLTNISGEHTSNFHSVQHALVFQNQPLSPCSDDLSNNVQSPTNFNGGHTSKCRYVQQHGLDLQDQLFSPCSNDSSSWLHNAQSPTNEHNSKFDFIQQHPLGIQDCDQMWSPCSDDSSSWLHNVQSPTDSGDSGGRVGSFSRQEIWDHNRQVGWQQWITLKGSVYHTTGFRDHFLAYNKRKRALSKRENGVSSPTGESSNISEMAEVLPSVQVQLQCCSGDLRDCSGQTTFEKPVASDLSYDSDCSENDIDNGDGDSDSTNDECSDQSSCDLSSCESSNNSLWQYDVLAALKRSGLCMVEIEAEIGPFKIGTLRNNCLPRWKYWENIRAEILGLHEDLLQRSMEESSSYEQEYLSMLQRWLRKYRDIDPVDRHPSGDGNTNVFFLPQDPDTLRDWVQSLPPLDTELPASGAWLIRELVLPPLEDTQTVFADSLRSHHSDHIHLVHQIEGNVAWREIPEHVIRDEIMTQNQIAVLEARAKRRHLHDPECMMRHRKRLERYFMKKYRYSHEHMARFMGWAGEMENNAKHLDALCQL